jgi:hypothetical protein
MAWNRYCRITSLVAGHTVDIAGLEPGICDRLGHGRARHRERGAIRGPHVRRLADADDAVLVGQCSHVLSLSRASYGAQSSNQARTGSGIDHPVARALAV